MIYIYALDRDDQCDIVVTKKQNIIPRYIIVLAHQSSQVM